MPQSFFNLITPICSENNNSLLFQDQLQDIVHNEEEGIVRHMAAATIATIYGQQNISQDVLEIFYDIMTHAVIADLHWEVKVSALNFWQNVLIKHLTEQGMIDGGFPTCTFSSEKKKIVLLTDTEIRNRLIKVLNQLSKTGCLAVFFHALQDDSDIEVVKAAFKHIQSFAEMLKKYEVYGHIVATTQIEQHEMDSCTDMISEGSPRHVESLDIPNQENLPINAFHYASSETVLEDILDIQDLKLLEKIGKFSQTKQEIDSTQIKQKLYMPSEEFLKFIHQNLECCLTSKTKWINEQDSFESLLDDMIREYDYEDLTIMDCYT